MLNLSSLLVQGESAQLLQELEQEWHAACHASSAKEKARVHEAIATDWLYRRYERMYQAMRDPDNLYTNRRTLGRSMRRRDEFQRKVKMYKDQLGFVDPKTKLRQLFAGAEDFDDLQPIV